MADGGEFPVEDADDAGLGFVEDEVVDFVVAVHQRGAIEGLLGLVGKKGHHIPEVRDVADRLVGVEVDGFGLRGGDRAEGFDLSVVEAGGFAEVLEGDGGWRDAVEFGERDDGGVPHFCAVEGGDVGDVWFGYMASIEEFHDVEGGADYAGVFAENIGLWHWDVGILEGVDDFIFSFDLMRCFGEEFPRWFLAEDAFGAIRRGELICRI